MQDPIAALDAVLRKYLTHDASVASVMIMYRSVSAIALQAAGQFSDEGVHKNSGNLLLEHSFVLHDNPFMNVYGSRMAAVYQLAVGAYLDSFHYLTLQQSATSAEDKANLLLKQAGCKAVVHEIALNALLCEAGFSGYRARSVQMRDELVAIEGLL